MKTLMVCLMILMGNVAQAQDVKDILSGVLGGSSTDGVVSNLTTVFSKSKQAYPRQDHRYLVIYRTRYRFHVR